MIDWRKLPRPYRKTGKIIKCIICNKQFYIKHCHIGKKKYCSPECRVKSTCGKAPWNKNKKFPERSGKNSSNWKGGKRINCNGYIMFYRPKHPLAKHGYIFEHRLVMEAHLKRYLAPEEVIHHKGIKYPIGSVENKQDNRIENLELFADTGSHIKHHHYLKTLN